MGETGKNTKKDGKDELIVFLCRLLSLGLKGTDRSPVL